MKQCVDKTPPGLALAGTALALALFFTPAWADHDDDERKHGKDKGKKAAGAFATNQTHEQECGACHWAYYPGLLPAGSWAKILAQPEDHFGEQLPTSPEDLAKVRRYLTANAADNSGNKRSRKIMKSLGSSTPLRISQIAYLRQKHHDVTEDVFSRKSVGGFGNCPACHPGAGTGDFDDDNVAIPR